MSDNYVEPGPLTARRKAQEPPESFGTFIPASDGSSWEARKIWSLMSEIEELKNRVTKLEKLLEENSKKENSYGNYKNV